MLKSSCPITDVNQSLSAVMAGLTLTKSQLPAMSLLSTSLPRSSKSWKKSWAWLELTAEQRSEPWFNARRCCVTGSVARKAMDFSEVDKEAKAHIVKEIRGVLPPTPTNADMQRGIDNEDRLRQLFMKKVLPQYSCNEPSLCMGTTVYDFPFKDGKLLSELYGSMITNPYHPQWFIGASPDGIILDQQGQPIADLECKVPEACYTDMIPDSHGHRHTHEYWLRSRFANLFDEDEVNWAIDNDYSSSYFLIETTCKLDHYCQIYGQLANTNLKHAYYLVGFLKLMDCHKSRLSDSFYYPVNWPEGADVKQEEDGNYSDYSYPLGFSYDELDFDQRVWQSKLYPQLIDFIVNHLIPDMTAEEKKKHEVKVAELLSLCCPDDFVVVPWMY